MTDSNNAGAGAQPAGAVNTDTKNGAAQAGANNQQQTVPITALHEERDKRQSLAAEVEALKSQVAAMTAGNNNEASNNQGGQSNFNAPDSNQFHQELDQMWREDPRKAMQTELMLAVNWRDQVDSQVDDQMDSAQSKYKDFGELNTEVRKYIRKLPVEQRAKPGIVEAAYFMVKGRTADASAKAEAEKLLKKAQAGEGTQTITTGASSGGGDGTNNAAALTPDQKAAAAAMGVTEDEYVKYMKK